MTGRTYVKDGLKLYMPYKGDNVWKGTQFVGTGSTSFDGSNDYISVADAANLSFGDGSTDSAFSISAWINMDDATSFPIATKGIYNSTGEWHFKTDTDDKLYFALFDESVADTYEIAYTTAVLTAYEGSWVHVCGTYNGVGGTSANGGISLYVNGVGVAMTLTGGGTYVAMENLAADVHIGRLGSTYAGGDIKNVAIWSRALTATEIQNVMYKQYNEIPTSSRLLDGLVSWWQLDGLGATFAESLSDLHGSNDGAGGGGSANPTVVKNIYGGDTPVIPRAIDNAPTVQADAIGAGSASFDGVDDRVVTPSTNTLSGNDTYTFSAWIKPDATTTEGIIAIGNVYMSICVSGGYLEGRSYNSGAVLTNTDAHAITAGEWCHVVGVFTGGEVTLYKNGVSTSAVACANQSVSSQPFYLGYGGGADYFDGNIAQVGIWRGILTQAEIQSVMEKTFEEFTADDKSILTLRASDDCADDDTGDWVAAGGAAIDFETDHYIITSTGTSKYVKRSGVTGYTVTSGNLYKLSVDVKDGTASTMTVNIGVVDSGTSYAGAPSYTSYTTSPTFKTITHYVTADANEEVDMYLEVYTDASGNNIQVKNFKLEEVTHDLVSYWALDEAEDVLSFDGSGDYVKIDNAYGSIGTSSISMWIYDDSTISGSYQFIFDSRVSGASGTGHVWIYNNTITVSAGTAYVNSSATTSITANQWNHFVVSGITLDIIEDLNIASKYGESSAFGGKIAKVAIYDKALSSGEITTQYNLGIDGDLSSGLDSNLVGYWKFDNASTVTDLSSNSNDGTVTNATLADGYVLDKTSNNNDGMLT